MTNKDKVNKILKNLSEREICFVSERHLQVEFAIEAKKEFGKSDIYPEYVFPDDEKKHIDLVIEQKNEKIAFEFKYIVCEFVGKINNRDIKLKQQGALPVRRYDCMKDISRLEVLKKDKKITEGYFILITNDKRFWIKNEENTTDKNFKFYDGGEIIKGKKMWRKGTGNGTKKGRKDYINIDNDYKIDFKTFKEYENKNGLFKYLVLKI